MLLHRKLNVTLGDEDSLRWKAAIRGVLNRDWNPIGDCPVDEYDSNAVEVAAMLHSGASDAVLLRYFAWAEVEYLGLKRFDVERARKVVGELRALQIP